MSKVTEGPAAKGDMKTPQHGNASKKQNHKTNIMSSSLNLKLKK